MSLGTGIEVLKCDDDIWRAVVDSALQRARVAVVDLSEPTDSVLWELGRALEHLGELGVLLTAEEGGDLDRLAGRVHDHLKTEAGRNVSREWIRRSLVTYPAIQVGPGPGRRRQFKALAVGMRLEIAARLAQPSGRSVSVPH